MKVLPTTPISQEVFGHWAVILAILLASTLGYALLSPSPRTLAPRSRAPSDFELRLVSASDDDFHAALPEFFNREAPLEIAVLAELAKEAAATEATP